MPDSAGQFPENYCETKEFERELRKLRITALLELAMDRLKDLAETTERLQTIVDRFGHDGVDVEE